MSWFPDHHSTRSLIPACRSRRSRAGLRGQPHVQSWLRSERIGSRISSTFLVLLVACLFLPACKKSGSASTDHLTLVYTAQTHGRLTPCGCFTGQYGGLTRLKTALAAPALHGAIGLDLGDAIEGAEDFHLLKYRQVVRAYALMHYAALNVGHREASLSAATLRQLAKESPVPLISANLIDRATRQALLPRWTVVERAGRRIAFVGLVDPKGLDETLGEGLAIEGMETCLSRILPELKRSADVLVLLAFTDEATLVSLAKQFYEVRVILGGKVSQPAQRSEKTGTKFSHQKNNSRGLELHNAF